MSIIDKKNRRVINLILEGIIIPYLIYVLIAIIISMIYSHIFGKDNINFVLNQGISNVFALLILIPIYIRFIFKNNIKIKDFVISKSFYLIPLAFSICIICNVLLDFMPRASENIVSEEVMKLTEEYNIMLSLIIIAIIDPIVEEIIFRGFFYDTVKILSNDIFAIIFTSIVFAIAHSDLRQGIYAFIAGIVFSYVKYKYGNIIYNIIMHLLMNLTTLVFVPGILEIDNIRYKFYVLFIMFAMAFFSIYRIYIANNE